ncbi:MAG: P-loop NTPase fold protein [Paraglaciecola sp.]|uniref:KAP family P-loop NTPase fold protein n=1 Tax=Paraglaciecola sp. TaxID=1920173 RepID=UPI003297657E
MDTKNHASKYANWEKLYNWETCKTNREGFGRFITHFLTSDSRVINLNGVYGSGKTEFIRRIYVELAKQKYPVVYIDVWESDFSNSPLAVICSELLQQIEFIFDTKAPNGKRKDKDKATEKINTLKQRFGLCLKYIEAGVALTTEPVTIGITKGLSSVVNATPDLNTKTSSQKFVEAVQKNHVDAVQAIKDIKKNITFLSELIEIIYELNVPIVILIDELDRCRPTYAIEILESIKHFFDTKGCTFLVATNTEVLEHSVMSVYGQNFDAKLYLRRFFDSKITLPQVSILDYLTAKELNFQKYNDKKLILYPFIEDQKANIALFSALFESNNLELRDVDQIINRFFAGLDYFVTRSLESDVVLNTVVLIVGLLEQHLEKPEVSSRTNINLANTAHSLRINNDSTQEYPMKDMITHMFNCVTLKKTKTQHTGGGALTHFNHQKKLLGIQTFDFAEIRFQSVIQDPNVFFPKLLSYREQPDCMYLLWDDHKKIIELSGHIE